jgi:hypothetical protein
MVARLDPRVGLTAGDEVRLGVAPGSMHFFDATDGTAIV